MSGFAPCAERWCPVNAKPESRLAIGLMSGTSLDGIDAALVEVSDEPFSVRTLSKLFVPYEETVRRELAVIAAGRTSAEELCRAHVALGQLYSEAVESLPLGGYALEDVNVIGCHGQTVRHLPRHASSLGREVASTLQIGSPAVLAHRTGITVVSDFRSADMAAGGQGAPLVPMFDFLLLADETTGRIALNLGGIANVTLLPPGGSPEEVIAFDTGPGNMLLDLLAREISGGGKNSDHDGEIAAGGNIIKPLLGNLLDHPFLKRNPPKSTGREEFGEELLQPLLRRGYGSADLMATLTAFTAHSISYGIERFWPLPEPPQEVITSGGGLHNGTLMRSLGERLKGFTIRPIDDFGVDADFKEAIAFAVLADRTLRGRPGNLPSATGAHRPVILGSITPGRNYSGLS